MPALKPLHEILSWDAGGLGLILNMWNVVYKIAAYRTIHRRQGILIIN